MVAPIVVDDVGFFLNCLLVLLLCSCCGRFLMGCSGHDRPRSILVYVFFHRHYTKCCMEETTEFKAIQWNDELTCRAERK